jgi:hypothetical protein
MRKQRRDRVIAQDLRGGHRGLQTVEDPELAGHHDRREDFDLVADDRAVKGRIGDADDRQRIVIDLDRLADDVWIGAEISAPERVADDPHRMPARLEAIRGLEDASTFGMDAEDVEVVSGHELGPDRA